MLTNDAVPLIPNPDRLDNFLLTSVTSCARNSSSVRLATVRLHEEEKMPRVYPDLTHARLREVLHYDPKTGVWTWKVNSGSRGKAGARAGCVSVVNYGGADLYRYRLMSVDGQTYRSARLAWFYMKGEWPPQGYEVDHKNTDALDDHWENLRLATSGQQKANKRGKGKTGFKGVDLHKPSGRYRARIGPAGNQRSLGYFPTAEEAHAAYCRAVREEHGEFGNVGHMGKTDDFYVWELIHEGACSICTKSAEDAGGLESHPNPCMDGNFWGHLCQECKLLVMTMEMHDLEIADKALAYLRHHMPEDAA